MEQPEVPPSIALNSVPSQFGFEGDDIPSAWKREKNPENSHFQDELILVLANARELS